MKIGIEEYKRIRNNLKSLLDLNKLSYPRGMLFTILTQKKVDLIKREYPKVVKRLDEIESYWKTKKMLPRWVRLTPVMKARILMKSLGFTNNEILKALKNPEIIEDENLSKLVKKAVSTDYIYSPLAVKHQLARGRLGENIIRNWLRNRGIEFKDENEVRKISKKTPDFYFENEVEINGMKIKWIESKALFGDFKTHWIYSKKQYSQYFNLFGRGFVVYWFGCIDGLNGSILDEDNFRTTMKNALLDMRIYFTDSIEKAQKLVKNLEITCVVNFTDCFIDCSIEKNFQTENAEKIAEKIIECYENGRVLVLFESLKDSNVKKSKWLLRNMGFDVVTV